MAVKVKYYSEKGEEKDPINLSGPIFESDFDKNSVYYSVVGYLAAQRENNASVKDRSDVRGSNRKPWRQKGTGRARHGSRQSPIWVGGGVTFGPERKEYNYKVNKKVKRKGLYTALSKRASEDRIIIIDKGKYESPATKLISLTLKAIGIYGEDILLLHEGKDENFYKSCRNIKNLNILEASRANAHSVLEKDWVVITTDALPVIEEVFS